MVRGAGTTDQAVVEVESGREVCFSVFAEERTKERFSRRSSSGDGGHIRKSLISCDLFLRSCLALTAIYVHVLFAFKTRQLFIAAILRSQKGISFDASYKEKKDT